MPFSSNGGIGQPSAPVSSLPTSVWPRRFLMCQGRGDPYTTRSRGAPLDSSPRVPTPCHVAPAPTKAQSPRTTNQANTHLEHEYRYAYTYTRSKCRRSLLVAAQPQPLAGLRGPELILSQAHPCPKAHNRFKHSFVPTWPLSLTTTPQTPYNCNSIHLLLPGSCPCTSS